MTLVQHYVRLKCSLKGYFMAYQKQRRPRGPFHSPTHHRRRRARGRRRRDLGQPVGFVFYQQPAGDDASADSRAGSPKIIYR